MSGWWRGREHGPGRDKERTQERQFEREPLRLPDLDTVGIFFLGDDVHGRDELQRAGLAAHLATQTFDVRQEPVRREGGQVALRELVRTLALIRFPKFFTNEVSASHDFQLPGANGL